VNCQKAAEALREAIRLQPEFAGAHTTLAAVLRQLGDTEGAAAEARAGAEIAKQKTSEQAALFATNSGRRLLNAGDIEGAISQFRAAITFFAGLCGRPLSAGAGAASTGKIRRSTRGVSESDEARSQLDAAGIQKELGML